MTTEATAGTTVSQFIDESARRQFESAWGEGGPEPIERFLPPEDHASYLPTLEELISIELEFAWKSRNRTAAQDSSRVLQSPLVEDYLARFPRLNQPALLLRLVQQEYRVRQRYGDKPSASVFRLRFPELVLTGQEIVTTHPGSSESRPVFAQVPGYEILNVLGQGGMGVVYQARQISLNRIVALKSILAGPHAGAEEIARFRTEAEAVARFQHPNIVQIHEIGEHNNLPYFSLEFCPGGSLADKLVGIPIPPTEAAQLVETLARAIHAAHQQGIVHRDLKPANVLLAADGTPKITDFGLAKQLDADSGQTRSGAILGTPSYMAPEQAAGRVRDIGPTTDVYALGAILYELLAGRPPFRAATILDTLEQVRSQDPVPPSRLQPKVARDLETICLKCLQKESGKRYSGAEALADDLRRFMNNEPIWARPVGRVERLWRWSRRHPGVASLTAVVCLLLLITLAGLSTGLAVVLDLNRDLERANQELASANVSLDAARQTAETRQKEADQARQQTQAAHNYLITAFRKPDPSVSGYMITVADVLAQAAAQVEKEPDMAPASKAGLLWAVGRSYLGLGLHKEAIQVLERERAIRRQHQGPDHPDTLSAMHNLSLAYRDSGRLQDALLLIEETLKLRKAKLGPGHSDTLASMSNLAAAFVEAGQMARAIALLEETLKLQKARQGPDDPEILFSMHCLAEAYRGSDRLPQAIALHEEALKLRMARLGLDHPDTLLSMSNLAATYYSAGRLQDALPLVQETLKLQKAKLGPDHFLTLASMNILAAAYGNTGRLTEAIALHEETVKVGKAKLGPDHPFTLEWMNNLAAAYLDAGRLQDALPLFEETLKLQKAKLGPDHPNTLLSMCNLAAAYRRNGQPTQAIALHEQTLKLRKAKLGPDHSDTLDSMQNLAAAYLDAGRGDDALPLFEESLKLRKAKQGPDHPDLAAALAGLGNCLLKIKKYADAEPPLRESLAIRENKLPESWQRFQTQSLLGGSLLGQKKYADAEPLLLQGYEGMARAKDPPAPNLLSEAAGRLVELYETWGQPAKAEQWRAKQDAAKLGPAPKNN